MQKNIRKVTLTGGKNHVSGLGGDHACIKNNSTATIYASANADISETATIGVLPILPGESAVLPGCAGNLYLLGTGDVVIIGSDLAENFFKPAPVGGGGTVDETARNAINAHIANTDMHITSDELADTISNPNMLINPDFRINQRKASGTVSDIGYFVDRWQLVSGTVTVNNDGSITLNGEIRQILEYYVGSNVTASASAGNVAYDPDSKTFSLSANGETIRWAKLEKGNKATLFTPPNPATELAKCQRFFLEINSNATARIIAGFGSAHTSTRVTLMINTPVPLRTTPKVRLSGSWAVRTQIEGSGSVIPISDMETATYITLNSVNCIGVAAIANTSTFTAGALYFLQGNKSNDDVTYPSLTLDAEIS